LGRERLFRLEP